MGHRDSALPLAVVGAVGLGVGLLWMTRIVLNDPPYGTERSYNGLRLAGTLAKRPGVAVRVFLMADAAGGAKAGQKVLQGFYNLGRMLQVVLQHGGEVGRVVVF